MNTNSTYNPFFSAFLQLITPEAWEWYGYQIKFFVLFIARLIDKLFQLFLYILKIRTLQTSEANNLLQQDNKLEVPMYKEIAPFGWDIIEGGEDVSFQSNLELNSSSLPKEENTSFFSVEAADSSVSATQANLENEIPCYNVAASDSEEEYPDNWK
jgi:hypothetical protein